tara:strand:+ start:374 stop:1408 length:1035 start_codon:yes stop_codon:yes gene_type:complete
MTYSSLPLTAEQIRARGSREIIPEGEIRDVEKKLQITLRRPAEKPVTYSDLKGIAKNTVYYPRTTTFSMKCLVEKIPVPNINRVLGLSSTLKNVINKKPVYIYTNKNSEEIEYPDHYVKDVGATIGLKTIGDLGTKYDLVIKDITNTKWYNWNTKQFEPGYNSKKEVVDLAHVELIIPPQLSETKYHIFFNQKKSGLTSYTLDMPSEDNPWVIYQLMKATTTFAFEDVDSRFIPETTTSKTHNPNAIINAGSTNDGKIDFTITVLPKTGTITIKGSGASLVVQGKNFNTARNGPDRTVVLETDLKASVNSSNSIGTITGTITLGQSSIRNFNYTINPNRFFTIT